MVPGNEVDTMTSHLITLDVDSWLGRKRYRWRCSCGVQAKVWQDSSSEGTAERRAQRLGLQHAKTSR